MQFDRNQKRSRIIPKGGGFYIALTLAVVATGVGVWGSVNNSLRKNPFITETSKAQSTIDWGNYVTRPVMEDFTRMVNDPAKNVPDPRSFGSSKTSAASAAATSAQIATKPENAPYTGSFALPFGTRIIKDYSDGEMVRSATMGDWRVHNGVDFAGEQDAPVVAMQSGTVKNVAHDSLWGVVVTIDHGQGVTARYCGLAEGSAPKEGQAVGRGEQVGIIAQVPCESADGIHLHLEVLVNGKVADPLAVMNRAG